MKFVVMLSETRLGTTSLEAADPSNGFAIGRIQQEIENMYNLILEHCIKNNIEHEKDVTLLFLSTYLIPDLELIDEINGKKLDTNAYIESINGEFNIIVGQIPHPLYKKITC